MFGESWQPVLWGCQTNYIRSELVLWMGWTGGLGAPCTHLYSPGSSACRCELFGSPKSGLTGMLSRSSDPAQVQSPRAAELGPCSLLCWLTEGLGTCNPFFFPQIRQRTGSRLMLELLSEHPLCDQKPTDTMRAIRVGWGRNSNKKPKAGQPGHTGCHDEAGLWTQVCLAPRFSKILSYVTQIPW